MSSLLSSVGGQYARTVCLVDTCPLCDSPMESASGLRPQEGRQTHDDDVLSPL